MADELRLEPSGAKGVLEASIRIDRELGRKPFLVYAITIPLAPVRLSEKAQDDEPLLRLHSIRLEVRSWRALDGRTFSFPNVVTTVEADGESRQVYDIYGSLRLGEEYQQVDMASIGFGRVDGGCVVASLQGTITSTAEPDHFSPVDFRCEATLEILPVSVKGDVASGDVPSPSEAAELAATLLDLDDYESPRKEKGSTVFAPAG